MPKLRPIGKPLELGIAAPRDTNGSDNYYELDTWASVIGTGNIVANELCCRCYRNGGGGSSQDVIVGGAASQTLNGGDDNDVLVAFHAGANTLNGGAAPTFSWAATVRISSTAAAGNDYLAGGKGADKFVADALGAANRDIIIDYNFAEGDVLDLSALLTDFDPGDNIANFVNVSATGDDLLVRVDATGSGAFGAAQDAFVLAGANTNSHDPIKILIDASQQHIMTG